MLRTFAMHMTALRPAVAHLRITLLPPSKHTPNLECQQRGQRLAPITSSAAPETITSTANSLVKHCVKLRTSSRYRADNHQFVLTGLDLLQEAAGGQGGHLHARVLFTSQHAAAATTMQPAWLSADRVVVATEAVMKKLTGLNSVDSVEAVAQLDMAPYADLMTWPPMAGTGSAGASTGSSTGPAGASTSTSTGSSTGINTGAAGAAGATGSLPTRAAASAPLQPTSGAAMPSQVLVASSAAQGPAQPSDGLAAAAAAVAASGRGGVQAPSRGHRQTRLRRLLALDGVQDPGNMGTLMRSALAFGWDAVYLLPGCCDPFNDKAVRASRGAALRLTLSEGTLDTLVQVCRHHGLQLIAAEPEPPAALTDQAPAPATPDGGGAACLVLGSEGQGLSPAVLQACQPVSIPMIGDMESLNVGVAGSILMFMLSPGATQGVSSRLSRLGLGGLAADAQDG